MSRPFLIAAAMFCLCLTALSQEPAPATPAAQAPAAQTAVPPGAASQPQRNPDGTYTIRTNARLVVLDLVASDRKGNVLTDLKREDFHVTEAGDPETILNFQAPGAFTPAADLTIDSTADLDRVAPRAPVNIVLLDEFNTRFEDMAFARYSLKEFLKRQPDKLTTPTILIAVSLQNFTVLHDYTQDKAALIAALDHHFVAYPWQVHNYTWLGERFTAAFVTLRRVALATEGHPGHKNMIWIGRGFPAFVATSGTEVDAQQRIDSAVQQCINSLRDARVTLYTIDPAGIQVSPDSTYGNGGGFPDVAADPFGGNYQFSILARATGGRTLYGRNDVDVEIGTAIRDGASFYTLTYRPVSGSNDTAKFRRIKVTVDRPDTQIYTRQGYYLQGRPRPVDPENPSRSLLTDLGAALTSSMVYDGVKLVAAPKPDNPNSFVVRIDPRSLTWSAATDEEPRHAEVVFVAATFDKKGKMLQQVAKIVKTNAPEGVAGTGRIERGMNLDYKFAPDPKAVRGRFVIRESRTGRIGTADVTLPEAPKP